MTDAPQEAPIRSADPFARIGLGVAIALLILISSFQISAHFAHNETSRELRTADNALQAFCTRFAVSCNPVTDSPATTTTTAPAASSAPTPTVSKGTAKETAPKSVGIAITPAPSSTPSPAASNPPTMQPPQTTTTSPPTTTTTAPAPPPSICTPQILILSPVCL